MRLFYYDLVVIIEFIKRIISYNVLDYDLLYSTENKFDSIEFKQFLICIFNPF